MLHAFEFDGKHAVVPVSRKDVQTGGQGYFAVADDGAPEIVASPRAEPSFAGIGGRARPGVEVLGVDVKGVGDQTSHGGLRRFIHAQKVADVDEHAEVLVIYGVDQSFHAVAVLAEHPVILHHGPDAQVRRELRDLPDRRHDHAQGVVERAPARTAAGKPPCRVVAHAGRAEQVGDTHLVLHPFHLVPPVSPAPVDEIRSNRVIRDGEPRLVAGRAHVRRILRERLSPGRVQRGELDHVEAEFGRLPDRVEFRHVAVSNQSAVTI